MRVALGLTLLTLSLAFGADEPAPLLKPVAPGRDHIRVRMATLEDGAGFYHIKARVPKAKNKEEAVEITVAFECRQGRSCVSVKKWRSWGFDVPANRMVVLPELVIPGSQLAPKLTRGWNVDVKLTNLRLEVIDPPGNAGTILGCDLFLSLSEVTKNADKSFEPRLYFGDQFLEMTFPTSAIQRGNGEGTAPGDATVNSDKALVPVTGLMTTRGPLTFAYASINGHDRQKGADGRDGPLSVTIGSTTNSTSGVVISYSMARAFGIEEVDGKELSGTGTDFKTTISKGVIKELRIGLRTGQEVKTQSDLVLKDVVVWIDKNDKTNAMLLGPKFFREYFQDPVYACDREGVWRLHGRVKPELLKDVKTRPKKP